MKLHHYAAAQSVDITRFWTGKMMDAKRWGLLCSLFFAAHLSAGEPAAFPPDSGYVNFREQHGTGEGGAPTSLATNLDLRVQAHAGLLRL
jgi:hypothetical protein